MQPFNTTAFEPIIQSLSQTSSQLPDLVTGLDDSARSIFLAQMYQQHPQQYLIVEPRAKQLSELYDDLIELLPTEAILLFPVEDTMAVEYSIASSENIGQRIQALSQLRSGDPCIILTNVSGFATRLSPVSLWDEGVIELHIGDEYDFSHFERQLHRFGYRREAMVEQPGQFSIRGSIIDIYPFNQEYPIRLDFFDIELDSIRQFDPIEQTSLEELQDMTIIPATDIIFPIEEQQLLKKTLHKKMEQSIQRMQDEELSARVKTQYQETLEQLDSGEPLKYAKAYLSLWDTEGTSLLDYMQSDGRLIVMEMGRIQQVEFQLIEENQFWIEHETMNGHLIPNLDIRLNAYNLIHQTPIRALHFSTMQRGMANLAFHSVHAIRYRAMNKFYHQMPLIKAELDQWLRQKYIIQVAVNNTHEANKTLRLFEEYQIMPAIIQDQAPEDDVINIVATPLSKGFELPQERWVVLTQEELFNQAKRRKRTQRHLTNVERIKSYNELDIGDYVVHPTHGIGRYTGIETIEMNGIHKDTIAIEYLDSARILLPVENISQLQKYVGSDASTPRLNKLGGNDWKKTKARVQSQVEDIADELIQLYAKRESEKGFAFAPDTPEQYKFEEEFPYVETQDQLQSAQEIKRDMERSRPMDRLLVGDVGYGKTEVAMRAVFKAVMDGKQVAFLVPTTILAQQHYNSLVERFADWPFEIGMLSRFVTSTEQKKTIAGLRNGAISIVVGTHRMLSKDVQFNDLGLLIVDEEQRFGVKHKERLKQLRSNVDVLTLTATPIPRTLHMSMTGVRDLSLIETPPNDRFPVQTYVMERNNGVIKSAIEREMARGGQVFYLYNRVATIEQKAMEIQDLVPEARIAVSHGQMNESQLEEVLLDFINGEYDVLVTTTIIETGIDIPNVNTLFVEDADKMGLSTLYQLRGRVGRTHRLAYAYLFYEPFKQLTELSEKRLNAIREFTELGSGFKLAMRDLSIRGAGNLLGKQQSGFIDSVGYDMYTQMLKEAVERKQGHDSHKEKAIQSSLDWQVAFDAYIPSSYISDERQKVGVYKSIQQIDSVEAYRELQDELIDRFGEFPDPVANLLDFALIKAQSQQSGIDKIMKKRQELVVTFNQAASERLQGVNIFKALESVPNKAQINMNRGHLEVTLNVYNQAMDQILNSLIKFSAGALEMIQASKEEES